MSDADLIRQVKALQAQVNSLVKPEVPVWADWTPVITQSSTVAHTVQFARYWLQGDLVHLWAKLNVTGTGSAGNVIQITGLPFTIGQSMSGRISLGSFVINEPGVKNHVGTTDAFSTISVVFVSDGNSSVEGVTPSFALGSGDTIAFTATYERA